MGWGIYSRALQIGAEEYMLRVRQLDQTTLEVDGDRSPEAVLPLVRRMLGVDVDLSEALQLAARDPRVRALSIGELNPTRCAGDPDALPRFAASIARILAVTIH